MLAATTKSFALSSTDDSLDANIDTDIDLRAARRLARLLKPVPAFGAHLPGQESRGAVEQYIAARFRQAHGANIHDFMPVLVTMCCHGRTTAATGVRAAHQPLFLEQYLSGPVEQVLGAATGEYIHREKIAEIGNLVATAGGSSYLLFMVLTQMLEHAGFEWVVFTATPQVQTVLGYLGLSFHRLCAADPGRLTESSVSEWGSYYASQPQVVAGKVADGTAALNARTLYASVLTLFRGQSIEVAGILRRGSGQRGSYTFAA